MQIYPFWIYLILYKDYIVVLKKMKRFIVLFLFNISLVEVSEIEKYTFEKNIGR